MSAADFWMECDHWYQHKRRALDAGTYESKDSDASLRGNALHTLLEGMIGQWFSAGAVDPEWADRELEAAAQRLEWSHDDLVDAGQQLSIAFRSVRSLLADMPDAQVLLEMRAPLSHEPESVGYIDLTVIDSTGVYFIDHKFGRGSVEPSSYQNHGYAVNGLRRLRENGFDIPGDARIFLGINQPRDAREIVFFEVTQQDLDAFEQRVLARVEKQKGGKGLVAPKGLATCQWCDFRAFCPAKKLIVTDLLSTAEEIAAAKQAKESVDPEYVEKIVRARKALESVIRECVELVKSDPETYPDWARVQVSNGRSWDLQTMDESEIAAQLETLGAEGDVWVLKSPAQVETEFPALEGRLEGLTVSEGHHIRVKYIGEAKQAVVGDPSTEEEGARTPTPRRPAPPAFIDKVSKAMSPAQVEEPDAIGKLIEDARAPVYRPGARRKKMGENDKGESGTLTDVVRRKRGRPRKEKALTGLEKAQREILVAEAATGKRKYVKRKKEGKQDE